MYPHISIYPCVQWLGTYLVFQDGSFSLSQVSIYPHVSNNSRQTVILISKISFCNRVSTYIQVSIYPMIGHKRSFSRWLISSGQVSIYPHVSSDFRHTLILKSKISFCNHVSTFIQLSIYPVIGHIPSFSRKLIFIKSGIHLSKCIHWFQTHPISEIKNFIL